MRCARSDLKGGRRVARLTTLAAGAEGLRPLAETAGRGVVEKKKKGGGEGGLTAWVSTMAIKTASGRTEGRKGKGIMEARERKTVRGNGREREREGEGGRTRESKPRKSSLTREC